MRLNQMYLNRGYHDAMIMQYKDMLQSQGFNVELEKKIRLDESFFIADLFASNNEETRMYEFKLVGNGQMPNTRQKESIRRFKEISTAINAKPFVVYVNPPEKKDIEIEGLKEGLCTHIKAESDLPLALMELSPKAEVVSVDVERINNVSITSSFIVVTGDATIYLSLQPGDEADALESFPMSFKAEYVPNDGKLSFLKIQEYSVDTSGW